MLQSLQTGSHFFSKSPFYLLIMFLVLNLMCKAPKIAKMVKFSLYYCKLQGKLEMVGGEFV